MKRIVLFAVALFSGAAFLAPSHTPFTSAASSAAVPAPTPHDTPPYTSYKGVGVGTKMADARSKLGDPKEKSDEQDFFEFSSRESAQVYYDSATKTVTAVMVTYSGKLDGVPTPKDVFGVDAPVKPDGGIFKKMDFPKAGFWISYNKTGGDDPLIIIALNKM